MGAGVGIGVGVGVGACFEAIDDSKGAMAVFWAVIGGWVVWGSIVLVGVGVSATPTIARAKRMGIVNLIESPISVRLEYSKGGGREGDKDMYQYRLV